ncbi:MAG TPA: noncanonical pyrimidine nucleotidase, YjjG family, partial [Ruminococcaceae bacterium]|nr:noncanonical pyrimidine nucleotidase, YjjG family [Oscillospiraceae bacterium]
MIKNILFDLDDTILDFKIAERVALTKALNELGISVDDYIVSQYS